MIAIEIYVQIYDGAWNPETGKTADDETNLSEAEKKKLASKRRKEAAKKKKGGEAKKGEKGEKGNNKKTNEPAKEDPLEPETLLKEAQETIKQGDKIVTYTALEKAKEWTRWLEDLR